MKSQTSSVWRAARVAFVVVISTGQKVMLAVFSIIAEKISLAVQRITQLESSQIASSLRCLGMILQEKGDFNGAESQYRASLDMKRRILGEDADHPHIAASLHNLGYILQEKVIQEIYTMTVLKKHELHFRPTKNMVVD